MILDEHSLCNIIMFTISINQISSKSFLKPMALVIRVKTTYSRCPQRVAATHEISYG